MGLQTTGLSDFVYINGPAWYISSLLILVVVLSIIYSKIRDRIYILSTISSIVVYMLLIIHDPSMSTTAYLQNTSIPIPLLRGFAGMCLGISLYRIYISDTVIKLYNKIKHPKILNTICLISLIIPLVITQFSRASFLLFIPISAIILLYFWKTPSYLDVILHSRIVQYIGKISFSFYIMQSFSQNIVQNYFSRFTSNNIILNICYFLLNLIVGSICYYIFENKIPNYLRKNKDNIVKVAKAGFCVVLVAVIFSIMGTNANTNSNQQKDIVSIYSETPSANVTYRGAAIDGTWISPWDNVKDTGNWVFDEEHAIYTATDDTPLVVEIPQGQERTITFNVGPDESSVRVEMNGETLH